MQKIFNSLKFPAFALFIISVIYGGLLISDLKTQTNNLKSTNQTVTSKISELSDKLNQLQADTDAEKSANKNLSISLAEAQKQITTLQNQSGLKKIAGASTVQYIPTEVTKTVTQTVTQEVEKNQATLTIGNIGSYKVDLKAGDNAFDVLKRASEINGFSLDYDTYSFGVFIKSIANIAPQGNQYWAFYFNGSFSNVGASDQAVQKGDSIFWQLTSF